MTDERATPAINLGRRKFLKGAATLAGAGAAVSLLAACGDTATAAPAASTTAPAANTTAPAAATTAPVAAGGAAPAGYSMIGPVTGFKADADPVAFAVDGKKGFIYNQAGTYTAFSDVCTHKQCEVPYKADQSKFVCPCHGSQYDKTGAVVKGPAPSRLPLFEVSVVSGTLYAKLT